MSLNKLLLSITAVLAFAVSATAQNDDIILIKKYAENAFKKGDYEYALQNYLELYKYDKENLDLNYRIGVCYTETNVDKEKAVPFLEYVVSFNNYPIRTKFFLGKAYMYNYRFTEAIEAFYDYKMVGVDETDLLEAGRMIEMCDYAKNLVNVPVNVTFTLLDTTINSKFDDMLPVVTPDNNLLYFSSNRHHIKEYESYIYSGQYSERKKGLWQPAVQIPISSYDDENVVGITHDGNKILVYANGDYATHDIKMYTRKGVKFTKAPASDLPADMNTDDMEMSACFSADGNTIYFASNKPGGRGGLDLYVSHKGPDGKWGPSENMGTDINTEYDENYPTLSPDGKTFYFASKGREDCVGGYDIYRSSLDESTGKWLLPRGIGFPINNPLDNTKITFAEDGKVAYIAAKRKEGAGNLDIYRIDFGDADVQPKTLYGTVMVGESEYNEEQYNESMPKAYVMVFDGHQNIVSQLDVTEEGYFFAALYPGDYTYEVKFDGEASGFKDKIRISSTDDEYIFRTIHLKPKK
ncbi:MAG: PD40 domain-containing protein [Salinivirgaceae bacterium]|nr:PD40 domain-containing protein [Salinivirgaceae bacterium]